MTVSRLLVLAALVTSVATAVMILLTPASVGPHVAVGWLAIALAFYFGSLLVP